MLPSLFDILSITVIRVSHQPIIFKSSASKCLKTTRPVWSQQIHKFGHATVRLIGLLALQLLRVCRRAKKERANKTIRLTKGTKHYLRHWHFCQSWQIFISNGCCLVACSPRATLSQSARPLHTKHSANISDWLETAKEKTAHASFVCKNNVLIIVIWSDCCSYWCRFHKLAILRREDGDALYARA